MRTFYTILMLTSLATLTACNTMEGMGEDMQVGGKKIERSADQSKGPDSRGY